MLSRTAIDESGTNNSATVKIGLDRSFDENIVETAHVAAAFAGRGTVFPRGGLALAQGGERGRRPGLRVESGPGFAFDLDAATQEAGGTFAGYRVYAMFRMSR